MFGARRNAERPVGTVSLMLAAISRVHWASVVTPNVAHFEGRRDGHQSLE